MNNPLTLSTLGLQPSFGFGDRIGLATPGHVAAMKLAGAGIAPIFPQQSIREMQRTDRTPRQVIDAAVSAFQTAGWQGPVGADADHLKHAGDVDRTAAAGFTFYTIDPSDHVDPRADCHDEPALRERFADLRDEVDWLDVYLDKRISLTGGTTFTIDEQAAMRCAVKYGLAINHAIGLGAHIRQVNEVAGCPFEIELSIDETPQPTTLAEHYIIADQCRRRGLQLVSLAPRFIGDFEKGVDYKGDLETLERSLVDHAAIARLLGPYKLSLHSGSDKLSIYPALARATGGLFHVKTAGTSYLEALRVAARHDEALFRRIVDFAREKYSEDRATYHVFATVEAVAPPAAIASANELEQTYLECWSEVAAGKGFTQPGRQILHCTFGSVLTHPQLAPALRQLLETHLDAYTEILMDHFGRHLAALRSGI